MTFGLSTKSRARLDGVHPDLVRVVEAAIRISSVDFAVIEGMRTVQRQEKLVAQGASRTMRSRHLTGHAVDVAPIIDGQISWAWPPYHEIANAMKTAAAAEAVPIEWGGDWRGGFKDGPHWQLPWSGYPA